MQVFDIEADGLTPTKIHCLVAQDVVSGVFTRLTDSGDIVNWLLSQDTLIGHNIYRYDIPALERLLSIDISSKLIDTLALSWYIFHTRGKGEHGLASWGETFGIPKPEIDDWEGLSVEEYLHRCEEDVKINMKLWKKSWTALVRLYGSEEEAHRLIDYLMFKMDCAAEQERSRWRLDVDLCMSGIAELEKIQDSKSLELAKVMPKVPKKAKREKPTKPYKINGDLSAAGVRWFNLLEREGLPDTHTEPIMEVVGWKDPNPGSVPQVKDWLFSLGWVPTNFDHKMDKKTGEFRKIPQIKNEDKDEGGVCTSIKKLFTKEPSLEVLDGLSILTNRISILKGFLGDVDDEGFISAQIQGFTNTLRFRHKVVLNLPGVDKPYGSLIRGCLIAPDGWELCGSDMSSLEDRTKQHYMWPHDPEYVKEMLTPDFDPHLDIGVVAGMMSKEDSDAYKTGCKDTKKRLGTVRHDAKQVNYSCTYGVTPKGLVRNNPGWSLRKADKLHGIYWKRNWSLSAIAEECVTKRCLGSLWLFNPVSKLWYSLRAEKDRFSTLNQGTGTYCFDMWVKEFRSVRGQLTGQMHDEVILTIKKGNRDKCTKLLKGAIHRVNKDLKLNRDLDVDVQFGSSYAEIH